jgi:hypothetical protein
MTCAEFEQVLPDLMDGAHNLEVEAHLNSCPKCWELVSDLRAITDECKLLRSSEEPSPQVWNSIESALRREGLIRENEPRRPFLVPSTRRRWGATAWLVPLTAALLIAIAFVMSRPGIDRVAQQTNPPAQVTVPTLPTSGESAEDDQQVLAEIANSAPMMEATYEENLKNVNSYIRDAEAALKADPNDDEARQYLMEARQQKEMLYEMALDRSLP